MLLRPWTFNPWPWTRDPNLAKLILDRGYMQKSFTAFAKLLDHDYKWNKKNKAFSLRPTL